MSSVPQGPEERPTTAPRSSYSLGSNANMIRSLVVILGMVAALIAILPRVSSVQQPVVDGAAVVSDAVAQTGLAFEAPVGLPSGWTCTNARYAASTDGLLTWQAGWTTPKGGYVAIRQTKAASPAWLQEATSDGRPQGQLQVGDRTWVRYLDEVHDRRSLVFQPPGADAASQLTTVVTALADEDEVTAFTSALQPAQPR